MLCYIEVWNGLVYFAHFEIYIVICQAILFIEREYQAFHALLLRICRINTLDSRVTGIILPHPPPLLVVSSVFFGGKAVLAQSASVRASVVPPFFPQVSATDLVRTRLESGRCVRVRAIAHCSFSSLVALAVCVRSFCGAPFPRQRVMMPFQRVVHLLLGC